MTRQVGEGVESFRDDSKGGEALENFRDDSMGGRRCIKFQR